MQSLLTLQFADDNYEIALVFSDGLIYDGFP
jgi:hypothetical protein